MTQYTIELDDEQLQFLVRHLKNAIRHLETHGQQLPARKARAKNFRTLLTELETLNDHIVEVAQ